MNSSETLRAHLRDLKVTADKRDPSALAEWSKDLTALMDRLQGWLKDAEDEGLLRIVRGTVVLSESKYGDYEVPSMSIEAPEARRVRVQPIGLDVIGSAGRVDLECGPRKARLLRRPDHSWQVATPSRSSRALFDLRDLSAQTFEEALDDLLFLYSSEPFGE